MSHKAIYDMVLALGFNWLNNATPYTGTPFLFTAVYSIALHGYRALISHLLTTTPWMYCARDTEGRGPALPCLASDYEMHGHTGPGTAASEGVSGLVGLSQHGEKT